MAKNDVQCFKDIPVAWQIIDLSETYTTHNFDKPRNVAKYHISR
jgi:hypothetical protein